METKLAKHGYKFGVNTEGCDHPIITFLKPFLVMLFTLFENLNHQNENLNNQNETLNSQINLIRYLSSLGLPTIP